MVHDHKNKTPISIRAIAIASIICMLSAIASATDKPDSYVKEPDAYYSNPQNVGQCASCDAAYFNNPFNIDKNPDAHKKFFSTPGAIMRAPAGVQAWLKRLKVEASVDLSRAERGATFDVTTGALTNGKTTINPRDYTKSTTIQTLPEGGFLISKTTIKGFGKVDYDRSSDTYTMDGAKVHLPVAPKDGQRIEAIRDANGNIKEISIPANARYDFFDGRRRILAREQTAILLDGSDPYSRIDAAIGIQRDSIKINNKVHAFVWDGTLQIFVSKGRYSQKEFPGFVGGTIDMQKKDGNVIKLASLGDKTGLASVASRPLKYDKEEGFDERRDLVRKVQRLLNTDGYSLKVDGKFGPKTAAAVAAFQTKHGIAASEPGALDEATLLALDQDVGLRLSSSRETAQSAIRRLAQGGYSDPSKWETIKRPTLFENQFSSRLDTPPTVDQDKLVRYYNQLADKAYGKNEQLLRDIPAAIYQAAAEAERKYGFPIDPAKLLALAAHETSAENDNGVWLPFNSYNARVRNNFGGIGGLGNYKAYDTPLDGARALVEHMYTSKYYFKQGRFTIDAVSNKWCPLLDEGCDVHASTWKNVYRRYKGLA